MFIFFLSANSSFIVLKYYFALLRGKDICLQYIVKGSIRVYFPYRFPKRLFA